MRSLQFATLDPAALTAQGPGCLSLASTSNQLATLAALGKRLGQQQYQQLVPTGLLLQAATGAGMEVSWQHSQLSSWRPAPEAICDGRSLPSLLLLLANVAAAEQRGPLAMAAAQAASAGGNTCCAQRLLSLAEGVLPTPQGSNSSGGDVSAQPLLQLVRLQQQPAGADRSSSAWRLILDAATSTTGMAAAAPAAAQLLLATAAPQPAVPVVEVEALLRSSSLRQHVGADSDAVLGQMVQQLLDLQPDHEQQQQQELLAPRMAAAAAIQYAALTAAVAAAPTASQQWWQLASWLRRHAAALEQQQGATQSEASQAALAASFTCSCKALAVDGLSGGGGGGAGSSFAVLPVLLQVLELLAHPSSSAWLPSDAGVQLAGVPAAVWLPVVPQLLAALAAADCSRSSVPGSHRRQGPLVLQVLLAVALVVPCQVLLPAMVAGQQASVPAGRQPEAPALLRRQLLEELQRREPQLAQQLHVLMREATRLAVLPEEHWHSVLLEAASMAGKRFDSHHHHHQQRGRAGTSGGDDSDYAAAMMPVLLALQQQLHAAEAAAPQTPHEQRFREQQLPRLQLMLQQLKKPAAVENQPSAPPGSRPPTPLAGQRQAALALLRSAASELAVLLRQKRVGLADVVPALAGLAATAIPIPGAACNPAEAAAGLSVTLASTAADVAVLSTKTRPKQLRFIGSDGKQYTALLKVRRS